MKNIFGKSNLFTILSQFLVITMPFYVILSLYFSQIVGIPLAGFFIKELVLVILGITLVYYFFKEKRFPKLDIIDYLILAYITYGIGITLVNGLGLNSIIYGGRYDFIFLIVLLIYKHGMNYLKISPKKLAALFLWSGGASLLLGLIFKFRIGEEALIQFGYVMYQGNWIFEGGVPAYHGLEGSGMRRFQGILDNPNAMGFFLILYSGIYVYLQKNKFDYSVFFLGTLLLILVIVTYSRSALLGIFCGTGLSILLNIKYLYQKQKKLFIGFVASSLLFVGILGTVFYDKVAHIVIRTSSTSAHFDRMQIGINRFLDAPLGAGLGEAGPAFRSIYPGKTSKLHEEYYIPESWFIQVLIEGGIIYFLIFVSLLSIIGYKLYQNSPVLGAMFVAILIMNVFLHIFEATYISILTFLFIGLFINKK